MGAFQIHGLSLAALRLQQRAGFCRRNERGRIPAIRRVRPFHRDRSAVLHKALKGRKWAEFAKLYNGPDYQRNLYDIKLQRAYERHGDYGCGQAVAGMIDFDAVQRLDIQDGDLLVVPERNDPAGRGAAARCSASEPSAHKSSSLRRPVNTHGRRRHEINSWYRA
ncbi:N-acetylmuramidase domain-containing protein [Pseudomonas sp. A4]|nr:N-acetylmuramidase domain-containing protein [Pseudomonas sp. S11A4]MCR8935678.1 N-acetylmuramidase domain-containing protein [Pseudomonas sp. S11A4]